MKSTLSLICAMALAGCTYGIQNTSGSDYIARGKGFIDADIAAAAAVEPDLNFPARIGLARVVNANLTTVPQAEADLFLALAEKHNHLGTFVPISPLVAELVNGRSRDTVKNIRLAAARQHVDYLLIYEVGARSSRKNTPFALVDVTIVGDMLFPTRKIDAMGIGQAMLLDVRNGYPYGTASATKDLSGFGRSWAGDRTAQNQRDTAVLEVSEVLIGEIDQMITALIAAN